MLVVSHYLRDVPCKKYNYVKFMPEVLSVPFFPDTVYFRKLLNRMK